MVDEMERYGVPVLVPHQFGGITGSLPDKK